jgi:pyrophosphatase PpaX
VNYAAVLFDFDGTLAHTLPFWVKAFHLTFVQFGAKVSDEDIIERCFYRNFDEITADFGLPSETLFREEISARLVQCFDEFELLAGVKETLNECLASRVQLALVTSSPRAVVEKALSKVGMQSCFEVIVTADDTTRLKPHPEPVLRALALLKVDASKCLFVGDSKADMLAARAVEMKSALYCPQVHEDYYDFQELLDTSPHFVFDDYKQLSNHLYGRLPESA